MLALRAGQVRDVAGVAPTFKFEIKYCSNLSPLSHAASSFNCGAFCGNIVFLMIIYVLLHLRRPHMMASMTLRTFSNHRSSACVLEYLEAAAGSGVKFLIRIANNLRSEMFPFIFFMYSHFRVDQIELLEV